MKSVLVIAALVLAGRPVLGSSASIGDGGSYPAGQTPLGSFWASIGDGGSYPASQTPLRDAEYLALVGEGFEQIYNLDYEHAIATFTEMGAKFPAHPGPPLDVAAAIWLRELFERQDLNLGKFIAPGYFTKAPAHKMPDAHRRAFFESLERSTHLSEAILKKDVGNQDARFFRGSVESLLAAFSYTIDRSKMEAIGHAKKAYRDYRGLLAENPEYYDAYMGVGLYEYIVDNLRWYIKWLAMIVGYRGSEERGIEYLELAREKGLAVPDEASILLMIVYFREKKNRDALAIAGELHRRFPETSCSTSTRANLGENAQKARRCADVSRRRETCQRATTQLPKAPPRNVPIRAWQEARSFESPRRGASAVPRLHGILQDAGPRTGPVPPRGRTHSR